MYLIAEQSGKRGRDRSRDFENYERTQANDYEGSNQGTKARDEKEAISLHDRVIPSEKSNHLWENDGNEWPTIQLGLRWILTRLNERERQSSITPNSLRETRIKKLPQL